jgi:hypothetical protein
MKLALTISQGLDAILAFVEAVVISIGFDQSCCEFSFRES